MKFCFNSINLSSNCAWNTAGLSWLVLLIASWICWTSYRWAGGVVGPTFAASLEFLLIIEMWLVLVCLIGITLNRFTRIWLLFFFILLIGLLVTPIVCKIFVSISRWLEDAYTNSLFPYMAKHLIVCCLQNAFL